jgi:hypothetical protein
VDLYPERCAVKISVRLTINVDPELWDGGWHSPAETRDDVRSHILNLIQQSPLIDEANAKVELKP